MRNVQFAQLQGKLLMQGSLVKVLGLAAVLASGSVSAEVLFIDGGYAELCSNAAFNVENRERVEITGSRLGLEPIELCDKAIENLDGSPFDIAASYNNRGVLHFANSSIDLALKDFEKATELRPEMAQAHVNRGYALAALQRWDDSIEALTRGIELGSSDAAKAYFSRAQVYEEVGKVREAYFDYQKAAELNPEWDAPQLELARFTVTRKQQ